MIAKPKVSLVKCLSYAPHEVTDAVAESLCLLGGIGQFIKPGESVLVKPNLLTDALPEACIDTHPEVVRAVIRQLKTVAGKIYCGDSPSAVGQKRDIAHVYEVSGLKAVCDEEEIELVSFNTPKLKGAYPLTDWRGRCDKFISLPKLKTHGLTVMTAAVKNLFGLVVGMHKVKLHRDSLRPFDFAKTLLDIYELAKPDLTLIDAVVGLEGEGPGSTGTKRSFGFIAASSDAVALDTVLAKIFGLLPEFVPTNREAYRRGLGRPDLETIEVLGEILEHLTIHDLKLPTSSVLNKVPDWLFGILKALLNFKPQMVDVKCKRCGYCKNICPAWAIYQEGGFFKINYKKCILCLCCQEACPHAAIQVKKSFLMRFKGM